MKNKKILIAGGLAVAAGLAYYLYQKNKPAALTDAEIEAARQEQIRKENVAHLLTVANQTVQAAQTGGKAAITTPDFIKTGTSQAARDIIKFGTAQPVAGLGYVLT